MKLVTELGNSQRELARHLSEAEKYSEGKHPPGYDQEKHRRWRDALRTIDPATVTPEQLEAASVWGLNPGIGYYHQAAVHCSACRKRVREAVHVMDCWYSECGVEQILCPACIQEAATIVASLVRG